MKEQSKSPPHHGKAAVFLDRDGVLTELVWNPATGAYESPHTFPALSYCPNIFAPLRRLIEGGFELFIVSNQPSYAKGKTSLENIQVIAQAVEAELRAHDVIFRETYYCYHHPNGIVPMHTGSCPCRKPSPFFLHQAAERYDLDLSQSWMVGDRGSDVECGQRAGCRTIRINHPQSFGQRGEAVPTFEEANLAAAVGRILNGTVWEGAE